MNEGKTEGTTTTGCCTPSVVAEIRYASVVQAAGYRGILAGSLSEHFRINIHDNSHNS